MQHSHEVYANSVALLAEGFIDVATHRTTIATIEEQNYCSCKACTDWRTVLHLSMQYNETDFRLYSVDQGVKSSASCMHLGGLFVVHAPGPDVKPEKEELCPWETDRTHPELCPWGADRTWEIEAAAKDREEQGR